MPFVDLVAEWVPFLAEPGDAISLPVTVPEGSETGAWTASVWRDTRKGTPVATFTVPDVVGQVVWVNLTSEQTAALVPAGSVSFVGYWELERTAPGGGPRTWLKGAFVLDPGRRHLGTGGAGALTITSTNGVITATATEGDGFAMTAAEILAALLTVDGTGSGLDADLLDGQHADAFQTADGDLTVIAGLAPANDDVLQRKAGAWVNRTIAQLKTDLAVAAGDVSGLGALATLSTVGTGQITDGTIVDGDVSPSAGLALSKLASVANQRLVGNVSGGSAAPVALTAAQAKTLLAITADDVSGLQDALDALQPEWVFNVQDYGAVADGTTNDTPAINAAVTAAWAYATANESCYAEVYFPPSPSSYVLSSAPTAGGATLGNAQIPIPIRASTDRKITLVFRGAEDAAAMPYWEQTTGQRWGVTLKSTLTGQTNSSSWGSPCVLGGPSVAGSERQYGSSPVLFNNVCVIAQGIGISVPAQPTVAGMDFRGMAQARVEQCAVIADATPTALNGIIPANDWTFGLALPQNFNNDRNMVLDVSVYGMYYGFITGEHLWMDRTASIYCQTGIFIMGNSENIHASAFGSISIEGSVIGITTNGGDSYGVPIHIAAVSFETIDDWHIDDNSNSFSGTVHITKLDGPTGLLIRGASNLRVVNQNQDRGAVTAPAVPATTVAIQNPFWVDADVLVAGGTVTQITVDGVTTGLTSGFIPLRSGGTIAVTHSSPPTWKWWLR